MPWAQSAQSGSVELKPNLADWFYQPTWHRSLPATYNFAAGGAALLASNSRMADGMGTQLAQRLEQAGQDVDHGSGRSGVLPQTGYRQFALNPQQPADYALLLEDLAPAGTLADSNPPPVESEQNRRPQSLL